jgi:SAM-dependent methyltransferase
MSTMTQARNNDPDGPCRGASRANVGCSRCANPAVNDIRDGTAITPDHILEVGYGFWRSKALFSAVELGVFTTLSNGPLDLATLTARLGLHGRGARDFFDALVALNFLNRDEIGRYCNQSDTDLYLDRQKSTYIGGLLEHLNARHYQNWTWLTRALRSGTPQSGALATGSYPALYADKVAQEVFLNGMSAGSLLAAQTLARSFPWIHHRTVLDIGTAQGCVPVEIARVHAHLTGGGFDLPEVEPVFSAYVHKHALNERLRFYAGDFFADPLPPADVLVMGRILHNWDLPTKKLLLKKAYDALPDGGALIVYDPLVDDDRVRAHGLLSSLNMLIETAGGFEYTGAECTEWMREVGFANTRIEQLGDVHTGVIGLKHDGLR